MAFGRLCCQYCTCAHCPWVQWSRLTFCRRRYSVEKVEGYGFGRTIYITILKRVLGRMVLYQRERRAELVTEVRHSESEEASSDECVSRWCSCGPMTCRIDCVCCAEDATAVERKSHWASVSQHGWFDRVCWDKAAVLDHVRLTVYFEQRLSVLPVGRKSICPVLGAVKGRLVTEVFANGAATQCQRRHCHYRKLTLAGSLTDGQPQSSAQSSPSPRHPRLLLCPSKPCRILWATTRTPNGLSYSHLLHWFSTQQTQSNQLVIGTQCPH